MANKRGGAANGSYSTVVANQQGNQIESLAKKAKAKAKAAAERLENTQNRYGTAMTGVASQAYTPLLARTKAMTMQARARVAEAEAAKTAAQQSNRINKYAGPAMAAGQAGVLSRVRQSAEPGMITARQAIADAQAYYQKIGIDLKTADWEAKAALYGQVIDQNNAVMMAQLNADLQYESAVKMAKLTSRLADREEEDAKLEGAPQVVSTIAGSTGSLVNLASNMTDQQLENPAQTAATWAATQTTDPVAGPLLAEMATQVLKQAEQHIGPNGVVDLGWFRDQMVSQLHASYPDYASESSIAAMLDESVLISGLNAQKPPEFMGQPLELQSPGNAFLDFLKNITPSGQQGT